MNILNRFLPLFACLFAACGSSDSNEDPLTVKPEVSITSSNTSMTVSWKALAKALYYEVQYADNESMNNATSEQASGTTHTITGLDANNVYYVRVRGRFDSGWGAWSDTESTNLSALSLVVESYNILGDDGAAYEKSPWPLRKEHVGKIVLQEGNRPDVIGFQECSSTAQMTDLIEMFQDQYNWAQGSNIYMSARMIFWKKERFEVKDTGMVDMLGDKYTDTYRGSRYALWVRLQERSSGHEFLFFNIHVRAGSDAATAALRKECIDGLCPVAMEMSAQMGDLPVVVVGDFNSYPSTVINGIPSSPNVFASYGFTDTYTLTDNKTNQNYATYNSQDNIDNCTVTYRADGAGRIDYNVVWPQERFKVIGYEIVLNFTDQSALRVECPIPSDHNPVRSTLQIRY